MAIVLAVVAVIVLIVIFGASKRNIAAGAGGLIGAIFTGAIGIALLGTAIAFPPFGIAIVLFFIIRGIFSK